MIDRQLQSLKDTPVPPAREDAKARAMAAAMAAYAAAPDAEPVRSGSRPFAIRHGYKIAASLAALAVIGPMVALLRAPEPVAVRDQSAAKTKMQTSPVAKQAAESKVAPPVVLVVPDAQQSAQRRVAQAARGAADSATSHQSVSPPAAQAAAPPAATPAPATPPPAGVPPPAKLAAPSQQAMRAAPAAKAAQAECPTGRVCATVEATVRKREATDANAQVKSAMFASLSLAFEAGRLPERGAIDPLSLINAFDYPLLGFEGIPLTIVSVPWSKVRPIVSWTEGILDQTAEVVFTVSCDRETVRGLHRDVHLRPRGVAGYSAVGEETKDTPALHRVVGIFAVDHIGAGCRPGLKPPPGSKKFSAVLSFDAVSAAVPLAAAQIDVRFVIAVARFADLLRGTAENAAAFGYGETITLAEGAKGDDPSGERAAFIAVMRKAQALTR